MKKILAFIRNNKAWFFTSLSLIVFFLTVSLVVTQVTFLNNTMNTVFGDERRILISGNSKDSQYYKPSEGIKNKQDALNQANKFNEKVCEEGFILLKNENNFLPMTSTRKVSVFGMNSVNLVYGGSGSSAKSSANGIDLYKSLENAGFDYNKQLFEFYQSKLSAGKGRPSSPSIGNNIKGFQTGELPLSEYQNSTIDGYINDYSDVALYVISRIGGEGYDLPRTMLDKSGSAIKGANADDHYLQLDNNEKAILTEICGNFDNVVVIVNCATSMELGFLEDDSYNGKIKGAIWVANPGSTGLNALGKILNGTVNPSGHTVDTFAKDFTKTPSYQNFGDNKSTLGNTYLVDGAKQDAHFVDYEEGIYVGYRYYETRAFTDGEEWYKNNVVYPFGFGLSYAEFSWELVDTKIGNTQESAVKFNNDDHIDASKKDMNLYVDVKVTNTSEKQVAGKDVVQLYQHAPYIDGGIEKAHVTLADFAKTKLLNPGESDTVTLSVKVRDLSSFDYNDANKNNKKTYEADAGNYSLFVGKNAHEAWNSSELVVNFALDETLIFNKDSNTDAEVTTLFDNVSNHIEKYLSRSSWNDTFPATPTEEDRNVSKELIDSMSVASYIGENDTLDVDKKWTATKKPRQQRTELSADEVELKLFDMMGVEYNDRKWEQFMNQLTVKQMVDLIGTGNFNTAMIDNIGKPKTIDPDGPCGFTNFMTIIDSTAVVYDTCFYACECIMAASYNKDLAYEMGITIGDESLIGNERGDGRTYSGWYAPAVNIHRSQFGGRNWEYYSEDPILSGIMAANVVKAAKTKGVYTYVKHFAVNDQETDRDNGGLITWLNEQAMREIYYKPFEYTVKEGKTSAMMSSFNRIGTVWAGGCYELLTDLLRKEWGFEGMVITDYATGNYMSSNQMIRAGGDLVLLQDGKPAASGKYATASHLQCLRQAAKNVLFTVTNSNAMNGIDGNTSYRYAMPYWKIALIVFDCSLLVGLSVWGFFSIRKSLKKKKENS